MVLDLSTFDWGPQEKAIIHKEIFVNKIYERFNSVKAGDIVFDIGANVGAFTYSILPNNPKQVYCFEPSPVLFEFLKRNTNSNTVCHINKAIGTTNDDNKTIDTQNNIYFAKNNYQTTTFSTVRQNHNIEKIDFLKIDCEGGEYDLFTEENFYFLTKKVKYISGEWHLQYKVWEDYTGLKQFIKFRDMFLREKQFKYRVFLSYDSNFEITDQIFNDDTLYKFTNYWGYLAQLMLYIENTDL